MLVARSLLPVVIVVLTLTSCGTSERHPSRAVAAGQATRLPAATAAIVRVGDATISPATYAHWMTIGEATVEEPKPTGPLPTLVAYQPPEFAACVAHLRAQARASASVASLHAKCERTYEGIRARILGFLITGYWLRGEAAASHVSVSQAEVHRKFEEEREVNYPTAASFRRLQEASRQTVADLEFAVETQLLSTRLLGRFAVETGHNESEPATIAAFNRHIESTWVPRTDCAAGYVVKDCRQFRA
jgi:hypothetical protein